MFYEDTIEQTWDKISFFLTRQPNPTTKAIDDGTYGGWRFYDKLFSPPILEKMDGKLGEYFGYNQPSKRYGKLRSFILERLSDETTKEQTLEICKKIFEEGCPPCFNKEEESYNYLKRQIPKILMDNINMELSNQNIAGAALTLTTLNNTIDKIALTPKCPTINSATNSDILYSLEKGFLSCFEKNPQHLTDEIFNSFLYVCSKDSAFHNNSYQIIVEKFTQCVLDPKLNLQSQFVKFCHDENAEFFDYICLNTMKEYIQQDKTTCLNVINILPRLPIQRFDANSLKMMYSVLDTIIDKNPNLRHKVLDIMESMYQHPNNDKSSGIRANSLLSRMAQQYPEVTNRIQNFTGKSIVQLEPRCDILPNLEFIFMGHEKPCAEQFKEPREREPLTHNKFYGGLWASPKTENGHSEWYNWSYDNDRDFIRGTNVYYVEPKKDSRCLVVETIEDLLPYSSEYIYNDNVIDIETLKKDYDCIYVNDPDNWEKYEDRLHGWDVSSLVMLKADKFNAYTEEEWQTHRRLVDKINHNKEVNSSSSVAKDNNHLVEKVRSFKDLNER